MRLTNFLRDSFIRAAMNDVPQVDYHEQAKKYAEEQLFKKLPKEIQALAKDKKLNEWLNREYISMPVNISNFYGFTDKGNNGVLKNIPEVWTKIEEFSRLIRQQSETYNALESRLRSVAYACTTRKQLLEALPEFEQYLPEEEAKAIATLPAVANVLSDFVKAGWPKNQPKMPKP
jgi:predicted house-cleaning noncanonical NTP pyrophosphatase (MazG superfamily)